MDELIRQWDLEELIPTFEVFDASSKIPVGIFDTGTEDLGSFDECYEYASTSSGKKFYGKYCIGQIDIEYADPPEYVEIIHPLSGKGPQLTSAFCLPSTCTVDDFETIYYQHNFSDSRCSSKADVGGYSVWIIQTISILSVMIIVVSVATIYDWLTDTKKKNLFKQISVINSWETLFSTQTRETEFMSLYGLRSITMIWIILHHAYLHYTYVGLNNRSKFYEILLQPENVYLTFGSLSVSTFFTIGSVLTSYNFLKNYEKKDYSTTWNCIRRYVRLTPPLAIMVLVSASMYEIGSGPLWYNMQLHTSKPCQQYWWSTLLYVQNYINPRSACVPQAWYLAVDMQCYIIFSYVLLALSRRKSWIVPVLLALLTMSPIIVFLVLYNNNILATFFSDAQIQSRLYYKPTHVRFGSYVAGLLIGIWLHDMNSKNIVMPKGVVTSICYARNDFAPAHSILGRSLASCVASLVPSRFLSGLSIVSAIFLVGGGLESCHLLWVVLYWDKTYLYPHHATAAVGPSQSLHMKLSVSVILGLALLFGGIFCTGYLVLQNFLGYALMMASKEILWPGGIGVLILMCESGNADFIKAFLSLPFFKILAKLSYCMYLVSVTVSMIKITSSRVVQEFSLYYLYQNFFSDFMTSLICSFLLYIFIEMPFAHIGNHILGRIRGYMKPSCCRNDITPTPQA